MRNSNASSTVLLPATPYPQHETPPRRRSRSAALFYFFLWTILIAAGVAGAKMYSDQIQQQVTSDLEQQTAVQIAAMQKDYNSRIDELEARYTEQITSMESQIEALNELLTFAKDNADTKTDNSNKLYTQLAQVKKQLDELKKSLDLLR